MNRIAACSLLFAIACASWAAQTTGSTTRASAPTTRTRPRVDRGFEMQAIGTIVSANHESITIREARGPESVNKIGKDVMVYKMMPTIPSAIKGPKWAMVYPEKGKRITDTIDAAGISIQPKAPEKGKESRLGLMGLLNTEGTTPTLKVGDKTYFVRINVRTRVFDKTPVTIQDIKSGDLVLLELKLVGEKPLVSAITIYPSRKPVKEDRISNRTRSGMAGSFIRRAKEAQPDPKPKK